MIVYECENCGYMFETNTPKCPVCKSEDVIEYEVNEKMNKDLADITIKFEDLEDVMFDVIIEFLEDQHIKYEITKVENQRIKGLDELDEYDIWHDKQMMVE